MAWQTKRLIFKINITVLLICRIDLRVCTTSYKPLPIRGCAGFAGGGFLGYGSTPHPSIRPTLWGLLGWQIVERWW